jgi:DNA-binding CsgD family transcriptional regulator
MTPRSPRRPPLIERQGELERLNAALDRAADGEPSVTVVSGEAGIGKTRLLRELEAVARDRGLTVLRGDCLRLDDGELPFAPLGAALRDVPAVLLGRVPRAARVELGIAFPHLSLEEPSETPAPESDSHAQRRLFDSLVCLLSELGKEAPLVLIIDDFHWADRSTRTFTAFLAHSARQDRIAVVLGCRNDATIAPAISDILADLDRLEDADKFELPGLTRAGIEQLTQATLGGRPPPSLVDQILTRSRGSPLFANELLAAYLDGRGARLPAGVANRALELVRRVSPATQQLVRLVAVARRPVTLDLLVATCALSDIELNRALREGLDYQLLCEEGAAGSFAFRHELMRAAVYDQTHGIERSALHAAVAEHLATTSSAAQAELAFHWRAAGRWPEALLASVRAGLDAERARSFLAAAQDFEAAAQIWDKLGWAPAGTPVDRVDLAGHLADARRHAGNYEGASELCEEVLAGLDEDVEPRRAAAFYERLGALNSSHSAVALDCFRTALRLMPADEQARRARLVAEEAFALLGLYRFTEACERAEQALTLAAVAGASGEELHAQTVLGLALGLSGRLDDGERCLRLAIERPPADARPEDVLRGHLHLGETLRLAGRFGDACTAMSAGSELAGDLGLMGSFGWYFRVNAAADLFHVGRWAETAEHLAVLRDHPQESWTDLTLRQVAAQLALARDEPDVAAAELEDAMDICDKADPECRPVVYATLAELELRRNAPDTARVLIHQGMDAVAPVRELLYTPALHSMGARAEADVAAAAISNRPDVAHRAHGEAVRYAEDLAQRIAGHPGKRPPPTAVAHLASCRAEVQRAAAHLSRIQIDDGAGPWDLAAELWAEAADRWTEVGSPYPAAYAAWRVAEAILRPHHRSRSGKEALRASHAATERLGAVLLRRCVERLAAEAGIDLTEPIPQFGLTARERQVLGLLARGSTNKEIAAELVLSVRTIDVHVSHILAKLDADNRVEAAATAHRLGIVGERPEAGARR